MSRQDGIKTLLVESHDHPYVTFNMVLRMGSLDDPPAPHGLAYLAGNMLLRGTAHRNRDAFVEAIDILGSSLHITVGKDYSTASSDVLVRHLPKLVALAAESLVSFTCPPEELAKLRRQTQDELQLLRNHDDILAHHFAHRLLYDGHPYGNPIKGTAESLERITRDDVITFLERHVCRRGLLVACAGDLTPSDLDETLETAFTALPNGNPEEVDFPAVRPLDGRTLLMIDKPERSQTQVVVCAPAITSSHPDYYPLMVANTIFGGTFTSRLSNEVREKRGWSYGAGSAFTPTMRTGSFWMRFAPENSHTAESVQLGLEMLEDLVARGVSDDEIRFAQKSLVNYFPFKVDTAPKRLDQALYGMQLGWSPDWLDHYVAEVRACGRERVERAIRAHLDPTRLVIAVLGTASEVAPGLEALPDLKRVHVHPYDEEWPPGQFER